MASQSGKTYPVYDPSSGKEIAHVPDMGRVDVCKAIDEAHAAQPLWAKSTAKERSVFLRRWHDLMIRHKSELSRMMTLEMGKPLAEAEGEVAYAASFLEWFSEESKRMYGDIIPSPSAHKRLFVTKQPVGVAALITPWNFPLAMITRKAGAALAAGCTVIIKPSEETPFGALALAELSHQAGIPPGVVNVVTCSRKSVSTIGCAIVEDVRVAKLSFTGSTAVGKHLMANSAQTMKRVSMELGGNAPLLVFDSANVNVAVKGALAAKFRNMGQTCIAANRFFVQSGIYDQFVEEFVRSVRSDLRLGNGFEEGVNQGPLINVAAVSKVNRHVKDAVVKGGEVCLGAQVDPQLEGNFYQPTVIVNANTEMLFNQEETFGPFAAIIKFSDEWEGVAMANASPFGLISYIFSQDVSQVTRVSEALESGMVAVNEGILSNEVSPFGGIKQSGIGREGSKYGLDEYTNLKYVCLGNV